MAPLPAIVEKEDSALLKWSPCRSGTSSRGERLMCRRPRSWRTTLVTLARRGRPTSPLWNGRCRRPPLYIAVTLFFVLIHARSPLLESFGWHRRTNPLSRSLFLLRKYWTTMRRNPCRLDVRRLRRGTSSPPRLRFPTIVRTVGYWRTMGPILLSLVE